MRRPVMPPEVSAAKGMGALAVFSENGTLESSSFVGDQLASPWGLALAPSNWGQFGGDLLVGNFSFGDSVIDALNPTTFAVEGTIAINDGGQIAGRPLVADVRGWRQGRKPGYVVHYRRPQRRKGWPPRVDNRRSRTINLGYDAARIWRACALRRAPSARSRRHRLTKAEGREKEPPEIGRFFFPAAGRGEIATGRLPRPQLL